MRLYKELTVIEVDDHEIVKAMEQGFMPSGVESTPCINGVI